jgi:exosortase
MDRRRSLVVALSLMIFSFALLYWPVLRKLVADWANDDNYSHGFFIVPLAAFFAWERRERLAQLPINPAYSGALVIIGSLGLLLAGLLGAELFVSRVSMLGVLVGTILFVCGWPHLRALAFPVAFLILMVPLPALIFNQIAFPLQILASQAGEATLKTFDIPVLREGNVMILANTTLEVAEACSGIRSLITLLTLGIVYGYFIDPRPWVRTLLALATIPVAVVTNGLRVAGTGIAAHYYGTEAAEGFFHTFSGWIVFVAAFLLLFAAGKALLMIVPRPTAAPAVGPVLQS